MYNTCLFVLTCGRKQYLKDTIASWESNLQNFDGKKIIFDDSGDIEYRQWLLDTYGDRYDIVIFDSKNIGLGAMMIKIAEFFYDSSYENVIMLEEDWVLEEPIDFNELQDILDAEGSLQVRLTVGPWYEHDFQYGGRLGAYKEFGSYTVKENYTVFNNDTTNYFWSNNPSIFKKSIFMQRVEYEVEKDFGDKLKSNYDNFIYYPNHAVVRHVGVDSTAGYATIDLMNENASGDSKPQDAPESNEKRDVVFLDMFNPKERRSDSTVAQDRLDICRGCEFFNNRVQQCTKCGCFMKLKTKLDRAHCPIMKW